jgi:hypothetical protein
MFNSRFEEVRSFYFSHLAIMRYLLGQRFGKSNADTDNFLGWSACV